MCVCHPGCGSCRAVLGGLGCCVPVLTLSPCPQISYLPFTEAFERAQAEKKLVHSILLWGALDDQSC